MSTEITIKEKLDFVARVGNHGVVNILTAKFSEIPDKQRELKAELERIPEIFGEKALENIKKINSSLGSGDKIQDTSYHILNIAINVTEAKSVLDINEEERYLESYFDDLWGAVRAAGIEYEDEDY